MPDELTHPAGGRNDLTRFTPEVRSLAKPAAVPLIGARGIVQRNAAVKAAFEQAKKESWTPERLAGAITPDLERELDCEPEQAVEVAQYLADEFFQIGDAVLVCDRTTGKAIARISDTDMYQPPDLRRESGNLAKPLPRLNPNLEGFLVSYIFEQERDKQLRADILARLPQTAFLAENDLDPRIRAVTRAGRLGIAQSVRAGLPDVLEAAQGSSRAFLTRLRVVTGNLPDRFDALPRRTAEARGQQNIVDAKAMNTRFSWEATIRARTGAGWVREMATYMLNEARAHIRRDLQLTVAHPLLSHDHLVGCPFWAGDAATVRALQVMAKHPDPQRRQFPPLQILPCTPNEPGAIGMGPTGQSREIGAVYVHPGTYEFVTREIHGRWEMIARMEYTLYVDWSALQLLTVTDIPYEGIGEIL